MEQRKVGCKERDWISCCGLNCAKCREAFAKT